jgi:hypothetical protein
MDYTKPNDTGKGKRTGRSLDFVKGTYFNKENHEKDLKKIEESIKIVENTLDKLTDTSKNKGILSKLLYHLKSLYVERNWSKVRVPELDKEQGEHVKDERDSDQDMFKEKNRMLQAHGTDITSRLQNSLISNTPEFIAAEAAIMAGKFDVAKRYLDDLDQSVRTNDTGRQHGTITYDGKMTVTEVEMGEIISTRDIDVNNIKSVSKGMIQVTDKNIYDVYTYTMSISDAKREDYAHNKALRAGKEDSVEYHKAFQKALKNYDQLEKDLKSIIAAQLDDPRGYTYTSAGRKTLAEFAQARGEGKKVTELVVAARIADAAERKAERQLRKADATLKRARDSYDLILADPSSSREQQDRSHRFVQDSEAEQVESENVYKERRDVAAEAWIKLTKETTFKDIKEKEGFPGLYETKEKYRLEYDIHALARNGKVEAFHHQDGSSYTGIQIPLEEIDMAASGLKKDAKGKEEFTIHFKRGTSLGGTTITPSKIDDLNETIRNSAKDICDTIARDNVEKIQGLLTLLDHNADPNAVSLAFLDIRHNEQVFDSTAQIMSTIAAPRTDERRWHQQLSVEKLLTFTSHEILGSNNKNLAGVLGKLNTFREDLSAKLTGLAQSAIGKSAAERKIAHQAITKIAQYENPFRGDNLSPGY